MPQRDVAQPAPSVNIDRFDVAIINGRREVVNAETGECVGLLTDAAAFRVARERRVAGEAKERTARINAFLAERRDRLNRPRAWLDAIAGLWHWQTRHPGASRPTHHPSLAADLAVSLGTLRRWFREFEALGLLTRTAVGMVGRPRLDGREPNRVPEYRANLSLLFGFSRAPVAKIESRVVTQHEDSTIVAESNTAPAMGDATAIADAPPVALSDKPSRASHPVDPEGFSSSRGVAEREATESGADVSNESSQPEAQNPDAARARVREPRPDRPTLAELRVPIVSPVRIVMSPPTKPELLEIAVRQAKEREAAERERLRKDWPYIQRARREAEEAKAAEPARREAERQRIEQIRRENIESDARVAAALARKLARMKKATE